jgi:hypothetical protein
MNSKKITSFEKMLFLELVKLRYGKAPMPDYYLTYESLDDAQKARFNGYAAHLTKIAALSEVDTKRDASLLNDELGNMFNKMSLVKFDFEGKPFHKVLYSLTGRTIEEL